MTFYATRVLIWDNMVPSVRGKFNRDKKKILKNILLSYCLNHAIEPINEFIRQNVITKQQYLLST